MTTPYTYRVKEVLRVVDADTIDCRITFGFGVDASFRFRLAGIDAHERRDPLGPAATAATTDWLTWAMHTDFGPLLVTTYKGAQSTVGVGDGAFGRWKADFHADGEHLSDALRAAGFEKAHV